MYRTAPLEPFLSGPWPPDSAIPHLTLFDRGFCVLEAKGAPGDPVWPGLFPRPRVKLARLALAASGSFGASSLQQLAYVATSARERGQRARSYYAHDAVLCALVHPGLVHDRVRLATHVLTVRDDGKRSHAKSLQLVRWAVRAGYVDVTRLPEASSRMVLGARSPRADRMTELDAKMRWSAADVIDALLALRGPWWATRDEVHRNATYLVDVAPLGHRMFAAVLSGCTKPFVAAFFDTVERALERGDAHALDLVVVGLFEAMQGDAYARGPAELIESRLGPRSLAAWADLIEGWTGRGIRSVAAWRARGARRQP